MPIVGIIVGGEYDFPFDVAIQLENVGGPSAGMMFALGIIDKLTPGELNGGENVAGTGTIAADGTVGPIGGIRQKMYGAKDAGADWFLAPRRTATRSSGHIPAGSRCSRCDTLDDALDGARGHRGRRRHVGAAHLPGGVSRGYPRASSQSGLLRMRPVPP